MSTRVIVLRKVSKGAGGGLPVGEEFRWTYTSATPEQARQRAWRALKRDWPNENPMNWSEADRESASKVTS